MKINCDACQAHLGEVTATARLILTVHCAFCGKDFGLAADPAAEVEEVASSGQAPMASASGTPAQSATPATGAETPATSPASS